MKIGGRITVTHWFNPMRDIVEKHSLDYLHNLADDIRDEASDQAPVETGALANSIAVVSSIRTDYAAAVNKARSLRPTHGDWGPALGVQPEPSPARDEVHIVPVVGYAGFVEFGTRKTPANPFLERALDIIMAERAGGELKSFLMLMFRGKPDSIVRIIG